MFEGSHISWEILVMVFDLSAFKHITYYTVQNNRNDVLHVLDA